MVKTTVIAGNTSKGLGKRVAKRLKATFIPAETTIFPDGESKITLKKIPKKGIILVVQSTSPPVDTNLLQLLSMVSQARKFSSKIYAVIPYMGYARQDRSFLGGEIITISVVAKMLKTAGAKKIIVVDIHSKIALKHFKIQVENVSAIPKLVNYFKRIKLKNPLVVSPDAGGSSRAKEFAMQFNSNFTSLKKYRNRKTGKVKIQSSKMDVKNRDIILVDDMISSGGSIIKATQFLKKQGAGRIFVACSHAILINDAEKKIRKAGVREIVSTNTISGRSAKVDISDIIAKSIK
jgi:ribose-phosphate pyrophosphokinase|tara:strand:- start:6996 stop:7871 length:876 start_codon:yes stop_codon:yes gene_type:complete